MTQVSISELKSQLSKYLREVRRGGEIQVLDRGRPVAVLTGLPGEPEESMREQRRRLVRSGIVRPGSGEVGQALQAPPMELPTSLVESLNEDRQDRI